MLALLLLLAAPAPKVDAIYPSLREVYVDLHEHPELAFQEKRTAGILASALEALGFAVTRGVGGTGVVGILRNGPGPTVMLRTELDGLPMQEKTGLSYASKGTGTLPDGTSTPTAHSCGHDLHMTGWLGTARLMAQSKSDWHGTLMFVGQPAEETGSGASAMLKDGLFNKFPKPDFAISMHDDASLPAGIVGYHPGYFRASSDTVEITIHGRGGHAARPHKTVDPIVIAARAILGFQTLVSRETNPMDAAVVTVGVMQAGTVANIIPEQAVLRLSVRAFSPEVRKRLLEGIEREVKAEALSSNAPKEPSIKITGSTDSVFNPPELTQRMVQALRRGRGEASVAEMPALMTSEDFSRYGLAGVPAVLLHIGAVDGGQLKTAAAKGEVLPMPHSPLFAPDLEPTLKALVSSEVVMLLDLLGG
ncbi:MAG TPA: amidohydrolase [Myxococcales bacterium]|jgi:hippurate hydrolase|nr:amidohydrolase [Myxococcales bacterium]